MIFTILSCEKKASNKVDLTHEDGNQKITIELENGQQYLEYEKPTKTNFVLKNIEPNNFAVVGVGIKILGGNDGTLKTEINVPKGYLENDTLNIKVRYGKENKNHEFYIPIKSTE